MSIIERFKNLSCTPDVLTDKNIVIGKGFDAVTLNRQYIVKWSENYLQKLMRITMRFIFKRPYIIKYKDVLKTHIDI